jgi:hypothetical protein
MKTRNVWSTLFCVLACSCALAETPVTYFDGSKGKLVIPHLEVNGKVYFVTLTLTNAATLTFTADTDILTNVSPPDTGPTVNASDNDIVGTWIVDYQGFDNEHIIFNANNTFEHFISPAGVIADGGAQCLAGTETGTWAWDRSTGILMSRILTDANGICGISHPFGGVPYRFFVDGNRMKILERASTYDETKMGLTRQ